MGSDDLLQLRSDLLEVLRKPTWCGSLAAPGSLATRWSSAHQSHFTRAFKRYTGLTPKAYRGSPRR
jgi:methylphosphotriester-DNA--protein-cysteine methyltransferase